MIGFTPLTAVDSLSRPEGQGLPFSFSWEETLRHDDDDDDGKVFHDDDDDDDDKEMYVSDQEEPGGIGK